MLTNNKKLVNGEIRSGVSYEDFAKVFKVFSYAPFWEAWTPEQVLKTYNSFQIEDGIIFGYYIDGNCAGILSLRPFVYGEHPVDFAKDSKTMYLSDIATLPEFRGMGVATHLLLHGLRHMEVLGYENVYLRTNEKGKSESYGIAEKCGFRQIWDKCQEVSFPRTRPDIPETDLRIFMARKV